MGSHTMYQFLVTRKSDGEGGRSSKRRVLTITYFLLVDVRESKVKHNEGLDRNLFRLRTINCEEFTESPKPYYV